MSYGYQTREEIVRLLTDGRENFLRALERHGWDRPDANGWSGKDHLAHAAAWAWRVVSWFEDDAAGRPVQRPEAGYTFDRMDDLNERDLLASSDRALPEVRADFEEAHAAVVRLVGQFRSDEEFNAPDRYAWLGYPAKDTIASNTFGHYLEHARMVERDE